MLMTSELMLLQTLSQGRSQHSANRSAMRDDFHIPGLPDAQLVQLLRTEPHRAAKMGFQQFPAFIGRIV